MTMALRFSSLPTAWEVILLWTLSIQGYSERTMLFSRVSASLRRRGLGSTISPNTQLDSISWQTRWLSSDLPDSHLHVQLLTTRNPTKILRPRSRIGYP